MKKTLFCGILVAIFGLGLTSCTVDNSRYTECSCDVYNETLRITKWTEAYDEEDNPYYYAIFDVPQISDYIYSKGSVQLWRVFNYGYKDTYQRAMPYCEHHFYEYLDKSDPANPVLVSGIYTQTVTYEYGFDSKGYPYICIFLYNNDFAYDGTPEEMFFHLRIEN